MANKTDFPVTIPVYFHTYNLIKSGVNGVSRTVQLLVDVTSPLVLLFNFFNVVVHISNTPANNAVGNYDYVMKVSLSAVSTKEDHFSDYSPVVQGQGTSNNTDNGTVV